MTLFAWLPLLMVGIGCFVKFSVVLSLLGRAVGGRSLPSTVVVATSLLFSGFVLAPIAERVGTTGIANSAEPVRAFLERNVSADDRHELYQLQVNLRGADDNKNAATDHDLSVLAPAFALAELKSAFRIGFFLLLPFLVLDLLIAVVLLATGMHTIEARVLSLPLKLLLFVTVDGWSLLVHGLMKGYT